MSETFRPVSDELDVSGSYTDFVLLREGANTRLFRASKAGKYFAIKTTKDNSAMQLAMLKREYELSVKLNHFHLPHFFTYEAHTPVGPGIVMEYVDGRSLNEFLAENPPLDTRRRVLAQIFTAVGYIHKNGIIHNDLKPENILITYANNDVKLLDFGLSNTDAHYLTKTLGCTRDYASPELLAQSEDIDARSDIYSIGKIMQRIFPHRYRRFWKKCLRENRDKRWDNVDQLYRSWNKSGNKVYYALVALMIIVLLPTGRYFYKEYSQEVEQERKKREIAINSEKIRQAFTRKQDRYTYYQIVPHYVSMETLKARLRLSEDEILDAIDAQCNFRLVNLATTRPVDEKPEDRFAVEYAYINRPYGCCIDRGSKVTIVAPSSWNEPGISNFSYYVAKIGGFNYVSCEIECDKGDSYYLLTELSEKHKAFLSDVEKLSSRDNSWVVALLPSDGGYEPKRPTQLHFQIGGDRGDESYNGDDLFISDVAKFDSTYRDLAQMSRERFGLESDLQRYHKSNSPKVFIRHLRNKKNINAFILRLSWNMVCWDSQRIYFAQSMADCLSTHLDKSAYNPSSPELKKKDVGFDGYTQ